MLVFTRTKHRANRLAEFLARHGITADRIHGNRSQAQRTAALAGFKDGRFQVLVATDIAARGIDIEELGHVVNFDVPGMPDDYIHRVGRTARAEAAATRFTLVSPDEEGDLRAIERVPRQVAAAGHARGFRLFGGRQRSVSRFPYATGWRPLAPPAALAAPGRSPRAIPPGRHGRAGRPAGRGRAAPRGSRRSSTSTRRPGRERRRRAEAAGRR